MHFLYAKKVSFVRLVSMKVVQHEICENSQKQRHKDGFCYSNLLPFSKELRPTVAVTILFKTDRCSDYSIILIFYPFFSSLSKTLHLLLLLLDQVEFLGF